MMVNGIEDPTPCCPSDGAQFFELNDTFVTLCYGSDSRCGDAGQGCTVPEFDWAAHATATEATCTKVVEGEVYVSGALPLVIVPECDKILLLLVAVTLGLVLRIARRVQ